MAMSDCTVDEDRGALIHPTRSCVGLEAPTTAGLEASATRSILASGNSIGHISGAQRLKVFTPGYSYDI
jgi:hypothetical protein